MTTAERVGRAVRLNFPPSRQVPGLLLTCSSVLTQEQGRIWERGVTRLYQFEDGSWIGVTTPPVPAVPKWTVLEAGEDNAPATAEVSCRPLVERDGILLWAVLLDDEPVSVQTGAPFERVTP